MNKRRRSGSDEAPFAFAVIFGGTLLLIPLSLGLAAAIGAQPIEKLRFAPAALLAGATGAAPLILALLAFMRAAAPRIAAFRDAQIAELAALGFRLTPLRILMLALAAGFCEELLFRGVLQARLADFAPLWAAILVPNLLFGALHARSAAYAIIAGGVGVWFGILFAATDALLAPMVAHALYDAVALDVARRAILTRA